MLLHYGPISHDTEHSTTVTATKHKLEFELAKHTPWFTLMAELCSVSWHYSDIIMSTMASQITSLTTVYSNIYSDADQRKHQSSTSLAFVLATDEFPAQMASNAENVCIWWWHITAITQWNHDDIYNWCQYQGLNLKTPHTPHPPTTTTTTSELWGALFEIFKTVII